MSLNYVEDRVYKGENFSENRLPRGEYENSTFINCLFANGDLSGIEFSQCLFESSDLSMVNISQSAFREVRFRSCKLLGVQFNYCNKFLLSVRFENCTMDFASFYQVPLKKGIFEDCKLEEVDFTESNLAEARFHNCNFFRAQFNNTILEAADFRTSYNFSIHPERNKIKKAKFSSQNIIGLLDVYNIKIE